MFTAAYAAEKQHREQGWLVSEFTAAYAAEKEKNDARPMASKFTAAYAAEKWEQSVVRTAERSLPHTQLKRNG